MQQVNFYFDEYHPKPLSFDSRFAAFVLVICFLGTLVIGWLQANQVDDLILRLAAKNKQAVQLENDIKVIEEQLAESTEIADLQSQLNASQKELNRYRKVLSLVKTPIIEESISYSQIFKDLSQQKTDSVWLTKINIQAQNLSLHGSSTKTKAIPQYVDELKQTASLKRYFDELKIERDAGNKRLINFQLLNGRLANEG